MEGPAEDLSRIGMSVSVTARGSLAHYVPVMCLFKGEITMIVFDFMGDTPERLAFARPAIAVDAATPRNGTSVGRQVKSVTRFDAFYPQKPPVAFTRKLTVVCRAK
jgi:hypothetical protein